jgi:transcriptional regulator with XRE-family HTH domain
MDILSAVREAIEKSGKTRYRIAKETGLDESHLSKLMRGEAGLSIEKLMTLLDYLEMELIIKPKKGKTSRGKHRK